MKEKITIKAKGEGTFENTHSKGVEQFGGVWIDINRAVVDTALGYGLNPSLPAVKEFLSVLAYRAARATKNTFEKGKQ